MPEHLPFWKNRDDALLLRAAFGADRQKAVTDAAAWFERTAFDAIAFRHHRLIAAVGRRFPNENALADYRGILRSVAKQLWMRSTRTVQQIQPVVDHLNEMKVPWAFFGNIAWQDSDATIFREYEEVDLLVHEAAFAYVTHMLWLSGWNPPEGVDAHTVPDRLICHGPEGKRLTLVKDTRLKKDRRLTDSQLWSTRRPLDVGLSTFVTLSDDNLMMLSRYREPNDLQWLIDLSQAPHRTGTTGQLSRFDRRQRIMCKFR